MSDLMLTSLFAGRPQTGRSVLDVSVEALRVALRTWLTRQALADLTARERADIGVTHNAALAEAARLPWDSAPGGRRPVPVGALGWIQRALERARTRRLLAKMQARELGDIGIGRSAAQEEASKWMWRT